MGEKNSDGGQFFTPREVIRAMVHMVDPKLGQTVYDPCCGTGGFLAIAYEHIARKLGAFVSQIEVAPATTCLDHAGPPASAAQVVRVPCDPGASAVMSSKDW